MDTAEKLSRHASCSHGCPECADLAMSTEQDQEIARLRDEVERLRAELNQALAALWEIGGRQ